MRSGWSKANNWIQHNPLFAYILVVAVAFFAVNQAIEAGRDGETAGNQAKEAIQKNERERRVRARIFGEVNRYVCQENNKQDRILAGLIEVSIGGQTNFGQGIPRDQLTAFDLQVLDAINHVQTLSSAQQPEEFLSAFKRALAQLRNQTPCAALVTAFTEASDTRDYQAIRKFLASLDRKDREAADKAAPAP